LPAVDDLGAYPRRYREKSPAEAADARERRNLRYQAQ
jgi:hypothetical protein